MTVRELIVELSRLWPDATVVVNMGLNEFANGKGVVQASYEEAENFCDRWHPAFEPTGEFVVNLTSSGDHIPCIPVVQLVQCGRCNHYHRLGFDGSCQVAEERYGGPEEVEERFGVKVEVVE